MCICICICLCLCIHICLVIEDALAPFLALRERSGLQHLHEWFHGALLLLAVDVEHFFLVVEKALQGTDGILANSAPASDDQDEDSAERDREIDERRDARHARRAQVLTTLLLATDPREKLRLVN